MLNACGLCLTGDADVANSSSRSKQIDMELRREKQILKRQVKILLLGSGESGKSTFIKQMVIIHGRGEFTADEVREYRQVIYQNVVQAMRVLIDAREKLSIPWERPERAGPAATLLAFTAVRTIEFQTFVNFVPLINDLWMDAGIKRAYEQRNLFQISDSCVYFFEHLIRISNTDYVPSNRDILFCRKATRGITEHYFTIQRVPFRFVDVGGQRSQRQKWFQCFEGITSILFLVSTCEFDQVILEDRRTNRVVESRSVFETIVNNQFFRTVSTILFLNKTDLLAEKIQKYAEHRALKLSGAVVGIDSLFSSFKGDPTSLMDVQYFLLDFFLSARREDLHKEMRPMPIFHHFTTAVDTDNIRRVFEDVRDTILGKNLDALMMQ